MPQDPLFVPTAACCEFRTHLIMTDIASTLYTGESLWVLLGRNLTLAKDKEMGFRQESDIGHDKEVSSGRNLTLGHDKEVSFGKNLTLGCNREVG